jgi:hypothetical protein
MSSRVSDVTLICALVSAALSEIGVISASMAFYSLLRTFYHLCLAGQVEMRTSSRTSENGTLIISG